MAMRFCAAYGELEQTGEVPGPRDETPWLTVGGWENDGVNAIYMPTLTLWHHPNVGKYTSPISRVWEMDVPCVFPSELVHRDVPHLNVPSRPNVTPLDPVDFE